jgi:FkbM family methyltransferase
LAFSNLLQAFFQPVSRWNHRRLHALARKRLAARKRRLLEFGEHVVGLVVHTAQGDFVVNPSDNGVSRRLMQKGAYGLEELELAGAYLTPQSECLVVGSHIGAIVVPLSKRCDQMQVIEASPENFRYLRLNLRLNACDNVEAHNLAANDRGGEIEFLLSEDNSGGSKRLPKISGDGYYYDRPRVVKVPACTIDEVVGSRQLDLLFMDIEGSEYYALKGAQRTLALTKTLIVEFVPHHLSHVAGVSAADFWAQLAPHFNRLDVPRNHTVFEGRDRILIELERMAGALENHDNLVFSKSAGPA